MIFDHVKNIKRYFGIHANLDLALEYMLQQKLDTLPYGKTIIKGDEVFINIMDATTKKEQDGFYEFHKQYLDIQFDLVGSEWILFGKKQEGTESSFEKTIDFGKMVAKKVMECQIGEGYFAICMIKEPHMPGVTKAKAELIKKGVIKVKVE